MITLNELGVSFGGKTLFEGVNLSLYPGRRYGLTGANGSGKTTFLNILMGEDIPYSGTVSLAKGATIGFLRQDQFFLDEMRVVDAVISGEETLYSALDEKRKILEADDGTKDFGERLGELEEILTKHDGYSAEARACRILDGVGIEPEKHFAAMQTLSGGYRLRVLLARALFQNPDILLLDEPTNHLDIISIAWLESYLLRSFRGLLVVISHDRHFLNRVSSDILDVDFRKITLYSGNYDGFMEAKMLLMEQRLRENQALGKKIDQMQKFVERFRAKATKARQAQSRIKQIEKIDIPEIISSSRKYPSFRFEQRRASGQMVLKIKNISKSYGDKQVLFDIEFQVKCGQKIAIIGPNGIGKSTLIKILAGQMEPDTGTVKWGIETYPSYFAQDYKEMFTDKGTAFEWLHSCIPDYTVTQVRSMLGSVLLGEEEADKKLTNLSGGEGARLAFAKIMAEKPNVLLLDEPTNHLDIEGICALEDAIEEFEGTCLFVSHDKNFVSNTADTVFELTEAGLQIYAGSYEEYLESFGQDYLSRVKNKGSSGPKSESSDQKNAYLSRKEIKKRLEQIDKTIASLEKEIHTLEKKQEEIMNLFASVDFYQNSFEEVQKREAEKIALSEKIESKLNEWDILQTESGSLKKELLELTV